MRPKAAKGLTAKGRRMGRPPKYLSEEQIARPLRVPVKSKNGRNGSSETLTIIRKVQAESRLGPSSQKRLALELLGPTTAEGAALDKLIDATASRLRRVEAEGVDRLPTKRKPKRSQIASGSPRRI